VVLATCLALVAFAGNSLLSRLALANTSIDAATFVSVRLLSGAILLGVLAYVRGARNALQGSWASAFALYVYAVAFTFAYLQLPAGTGALLLFGAVQVTMITTAVVRGERLSARQRGGLLLAYVGLIGLVLPGVSSPPITSALLMLCAGIAWGVYSLRGRGVEDPTAVTAGNFMRAVPFALLTSAVLWRDQSIDSNGIGYAVASGAITSGVGYAVWYSVLPSLQATTAATLQLTVPVLAALGGVALLREPVTMRLAVASAVILGGVLLVVTPRDASRPALDQDVE